MAQVVIGVIAVAALGMARLANRKINQLIRGNLQWWAEHSETHRAWAFSIQKDYLDTNKRASARHDDLAKKLMYESGSLNSRIARLERLMPVPTEAVSGIGDRVNQIDNRLKCVTGGHLDPVCPRCLEPLTLAEPPLSPLASLPVKPPRRPRAIHPQPSDPAAMPAEQTA